MFVALQYLLGFWIYILIEFYITGWVAWNAKSTENEDTRGANEGPAIRKPKQGGSSCKNQREVVQILERFRLLCAQFRMSECYI